MYKEALSRKKERKNIRLHFKKKKNKKQLTSENVMSLLVSLLDFLGCVEFELISVCSPENQISTSA